MNYCRKTRHSEYSFALSAHWKARAKP